MSTSVERPPLGDDFEIHPVDVEEPQIQALITELQQYYVQLYGGPDETEVSLEEFRAPAGAFLAGSLDGQLVATGGWRWYEGGTVEIKRMYVVREHRRRGIARRMLTALERDAAQAGAQAVVLETAAEQPAALAMYAAAGYRAIEPYGRYVDQPGARHLGRRL